MPEVAFISPNISRLGPEQPRLARTVAVPPTAPAEYPDPDNISEEQGQVPDTQSAADEAGFLFGYPIKTVIIVVLCVLVCLIVIFAIFAYFDSSSASSPLPSPSSAASPTASSAASSAAAALSGGGGAAATSAISAAAQQAHAAQPPTQGRQAARPEPQPAQQLDPGAAAEDPALEEDVPRVEAVPEDQVESLSSLVNPMPALAPHEPASLD